MMDVGRNFWTEALLGSCFNGSLSPTRDRRLWVACGHVRSTEPSVMAAFGRLAAALADGIGRFADIAIEATIPR